MHGHHPRAWSNSLGEHPTAPGAGVTNAFGNPREPKFKRGTRRIRQHKAKVKSLGAQTPRNTPNTFIGGKRFEKLVFQIDPLGIPEVSPEDELLSSYGETDGGYPNAGVTLDSAGNLYGTTVYGGANNFGMVYKITP